MKANAIVFEISNYLLKLQRVKGFILLSLPGLYKVVGSAPIVIKPKDILEKCILMHVEG